MREPVSRSRINRLFAQPCLFVALILGYSILHGLVRILISPSLGRDDVEEAIFAQTAALGYSPSQPPLFTWFLRLVQALFGPGIEAHTFLRFALIFALLFFGWRGALLLLGKRHSLDPFLAGLCGAAPLTIPLFAWDALQLYTHSLLLAVMMLAGLWAFLRLVTRPQRHWIDYGLIGVLIGLGLLSKYNYPLFLLPFLLAALSDSVLRHCLLDRRSVFSLIIIVALVGPHGLWLLSSDPAATLGGVAQETLFETESTNGFNQRVIGLAAYGSALFNFLVLPVSLWFFCIPGLIRQKIVWTRASDSCSFGSSTAQLFLLRFLFLSTSFMVAGILLFGINRIEPHHVIVPLLLVPALLSLRVQALAKHQDLLSSYKRLAMATLGLIGLAGLGLVGKIGFEVDVYECRRCYLHRPLAEIMDGLRQAGFEGGTMVAYNQLLAGGLYPFLPDNSRVLTQRYAFFTPNPQSEAAGQCLLVWEKPETPEINHKLSRLQDFVNQNLGGPLMVQQTGSLAFPYYYSQKKRLFQIGYALAPASGNCR